jgi:hypothetical protein
MQNSSGDRHTQKRYDIHELRRILQGRRDDLDRSSQQLSQQQCGDQSLERNRYSTPAIPIRQNEEYGYKYQLKDTPRPRPRRSSTAERHVRFESGPSAGEFSRGKLLLLEEIPEEAKYKYSPRGVIDRLLCDEEEKPVGKTYNIPNSDFSDEELAYLRYCKGDMNRNRDRFDVPCIIESETSSSDLSASTIEEYWPKHGGTILQCLSPSMPRGGRPNNAPGIRS